MKTYYKGLDENFQCRGFQYEVGGEYETEGEIKVDGKHIKADTFYQLKDGKFQEV